MKRLIGILAAAAALSSCVINGPGVPVIGNGESADKSFELSGFDGIRVAGSVDVTYVQDLLETSVVLRTDSNLLDCYSIRIEDGTLVVGSVSGKIPMPKTGALVTVHSPAISSIKISGSGDCSIPYTLATPGDFSYRISGSGDLSANVIVCKNLEAGISGSGDISIKSITAQTTKVSISGSGDADLGCTAAGDIDIRISGSGDVRLHGLARSLNTKVSGSGDIDSGSLRLIGE